MGLFPLLIHIPEDGNKPIVYPSRECLADYAGSNHVLAVPFHCGLTASQFG
jgi:hypothetical protein